MCTTCTTLHVFRVLFTNWLGREGHATCLRPGLWKFAPCIRNNLVQNNEQMIQLDVHMYSRCLGTFANFARTYTEVLKWFNLFEYGKWTMNEYCTMTTLQYLIVAILYIVLSQYIACGKILYMHDKDSRTIDLTMIVEWRF